MLLMSVSVVEAIDGLILKDRPRVVWIDAICINQADIQERNGQVQHMPLLYKHASRVIVLLRNTVDVFHDAGDQLLGVRFFCDDYRHESYTKWSRLFNLAQVSWGSETTQGFTAREKLLCCASFWLSILLMDPWFTRVWIVQEAVLASWVVVRVGTRMMPWEMLVKAVRSFRDDLLEYDNALKFINELGVDMSIFDGIQTISDLRERYHKGQRPSLLDLLRLTELKVTSDDRDKIYGVLGMLGNSENSLERSQFPFRPDYNLSVEVTYMYLTLWVIQTEGSLDVLNWKQIPSSPFGKYKLPSWVPDWSHENEVWHPPWRKYQKIGEKSRPIWKYVADEQSLIVRGYKQGAIALCARKTFANHDENCCEFMACVWDEWRALATHGDTSWMKDTQNITVFQFWYAIILGVPKERLKDLKFKLGIFDINSAEHSQSSGLTALIAKLEERYEQRQFQDLVELVKHDGFTKGDRMITTDAAVLGVIDAGVQEGDKICTLIGAANHVILHPLNKYVPVRNSANNRSQTTMPVYRLVGGTAHIPLWMGDMAVQTMMKDEMPQKDFYIV